MTILEVLGRVDGLRHNAYSQKEKLHWLSRVDAMVDLLILGPAGLGGDFPGYSQDTPLDQALLLPEPWAQVYEHWLQAQISYHNGETALYNEAILLFNTAFEGCRLAYLRKYGTQGRRLRFF